MKRTLRFYLFAFLALVFGYNTAQAESQADHNVYVGIYLNDITNFDAKEGQFNGDIYVWFKWGGDSTAVPRIQFSNAKIESMEVVHKEYDHGWNSVKYRVQAGFRGIFPLHKFPFDEQTLRIEFSLDDHLGTLRPDLAGSGMNEQFSIAGWTYKPFFQATVDEKDHYSDFGSIEFEGKPTHVRNIHFFVKISRPKIAPIFKFIAPLLIIITIALTSILYPVGNIDVRVDININTLLAAIAFQFAVGSEIPDVPYLVVADRLFILTYVIILLCAILNLYNFFRARRKVELVDKFDFNSLFFVLSVGVLLSVISFVNFDFLRPKEKDIVQSEQTDTITTAKDSVVFYSILLKSLNSYNIQKDFLDRGLYYEVAGGKKVPHLIEEIPELTNDLVKFYPDGKVQITWRLKEDLKWGDGDPILSSDLLFSLNLYPNPNIDSAYTPDDRTLQIVYKEKRGDILDKFDIYPEKYFADAFKEGGADSIDQIMMYNPPPLDGPFIFDTLIKDTLIAFHRNPHFCGKKPYISEIKIRGRPEGLTTKDLFEKGLTDFIYYLSPKSYNESKDLPGYYGKAQMSQRLYFLQPDLSVPLFNDLRVRQALMYGLDREKLISVFDEDNTEAATTYRSPNAKDRLVNDTLTYPYDVEKAKKLIRESGHWGDTMAVFCRYVNEKGSEYKFCQELLKGLRELGFKPRLYKIKSTNAFWESGKHGGLLVANTSKSDRKDFNKFFNTRFDEELQDYVVTESYQLFDEECIELFEKYHSTLFEERRTIISQALQQIYMTRLPTIPLAHMGEKTIVRKTFVGFDHLAANSIWWNVEYWYFSEASP